MQIYATAGSLSLSYPLWIGAVFALLAVAAIAYSRIARRRWALIAAALMSSWAAVYFTTFSTTITNDAASVYGFLRYGHSVRWHDARDIYLERRGGDWTIVVRDRDDRAYDFNVGDLPIEARDRVMAYMADRIPESAFRRDSALLKREAEGARPVSLFSDQQI